MNAKSRAVLRRPLGRPDPSFSLSNIGDRLSLLDRLAIVAIALQFAFMAAVSFVLWERHGLTGDFAGFYHAWYAIAHGDLNPTQQDSADMHYIQNHGELITWVLAPLYWLMPNALGLRLVQDLSASGCSIIAYLWVRDLLAEAASSLRVAPFAIGATAILLITLNPWPMWSNAFDFHWQATGTFFLIAAAYAFWRERLVLGFVAAAAVLLTGDVMATILVGLGLSMLTIPRARWAGAAVVLIGLAGFFSIHRFGGGLGYGGLENLYGGMFAPEHPRNVGALQFIAFMATHPMNVLAALGRNATEIYANLSPAGAIGAFYPWAFGVCVVTLFENALTDGHTFAQPSFQSFPLYAFIPVGTAAFLIATASRVPRPVIYAASGLFALNVFVWALVWIPHIPTRWILVRPAAAEELTRINAAIPRGEEVIGGEAFLGLFADRPIYYNSIHPGFPIKTSPLSIVIAPFDGINVLAPNTDTARIAALGENPRAQLVSHRDGVWWFRYMSSPRGPAMLDLPLGAAKIPAWTLDGITGHATLEGPVSAWRMEYDRIRGDVFADDYWRVAPGNYQASVDYASTAPAIFEVRNASRDAVIMRRDLPPSAGRRRFTVAFEHLDAVSDRPYSGWGPFQYETTAFEHNAIELRIWTNGTGKLTVYAVEIAPIKGRRTIVH